MFLCFSFLAVLGVEDGGLFLFISMIGHYSLFPLLYPKSLQNIKLFMLLTHASIIFNYIPELYNKAGKRSKRGFLRFPMLSVFESLFVYGLLLLFLYENFIQQTLKLDKSLPFLPLMLTSVYCSIGVLYFYISYYHYFLTFNLSVIEVTPPFDFRQRLRSIWLPAEFNLKKKVVVIE